MFTFLKCGLTLSSSKKKRKKRMFVSEIWFVFLFLSTLSCISRGIFVCDKKSFPNHFSHNESKIVDSREMQCINHFERHVQFTFHIWKYKKESHRFHVSGLRTWQILYVPTMPTVPTVPNAVKVQINVLQQNIKKSP